jgi:hypothetical protein
VYLWQRKHPRSRAPDPEQAWRALSITNDWIRHADSKTAVTLAFTAAVFAALLGTTASVTAWTIAQSIASYAGGASALATIICAAVALLPRVKETRRSGKEVEGEHISDEDANLLFFGDVHRRYGRDRPSYRDVLSLLTADPTRLTRQIADQIHANARIASVKFRFANWAIRFALLTSLLTAAVVLIPKMGW